MDVPVSSKSYESGLQMLQQAANKMDDSPDNIYKYIFGHVMTQMTATAGIKKHGQAAMDTLLQEFCQLDSKNVFEPLDASTLTASQKRESLRAVNLIKEKRSGKLKVARAPTVGPRGPNIRRKRRRLPRYPRTLS